MIALLAAAALAGTAAAIALLAAAIAWTRRLDAALAATPTIGSMLSACENAEPVDERPSAHDLALHLTELAAARGWSGGSA